MSKHNYTNYSKPQETPSVEPEVIEETKTEDPVTPAPTVDPKDDDTIIGVVIECEKLNVRAEASKESKVLCEIPLGAEVQVDIFESTDEFYKVCTEAGVEGYCVKDYINVE